MRGQDATQRNIVAIASRQGGVISHSQLLDAGLSRHAVTRGLEAGRLHPVHRGVYAVGHRSLAVTGRRWAAVLACGPGAALSHHSAGAAWGVLRSGGARLDVLVRLGGRAPPGGVRLHRSRVLAAGDVTALDGLPITTPARTLLDLAAALTPARLSTAVSRAEQRRLLDFADLHALVDRHPRRAGSPALTAVLESYAARDTRSALEDLIAELCQRHAIERPRDNVILHGHVRDFAWPPRKLVVEGDSYSWHRSPTALDSDRERDVTLALAGWRTLRFTYAQVTRRPGYVADAIRAALAG
jgi:very-short-patch-repair endonuclease